MLYSSLYTSVPAVTVSTISGLIVACFTFASIRITTSPERMDHAEDGSLLQRPTPRHTFQGAAATFTPRIHYGFGVSLVSGFDVNLIKLNIPRQAYQRFFSRHLAVTIPSSPAHHPCSTPVRGWFVGWLDRFNDIRYRHSTHTFSGWWWPSNTIPIRSSKRLSQLLHW